MNSKEAAIPKEAEIDQLRDAVEKITGVGIRVFRMPARPGIHESGFWTLKPDGRESRERAGEFVIVIYDDVSSAQLDGLAPRDHMFDETGIAWEFHVPERSVDPKPYWSATKLFGNARLNWVTGDKELDARWERLDAFLSGEEM